MPECPLYEVPEAPPELEFDPFLGAAVARPPFRIRLPYGEGDCWLATRYDDVRFVTSDPRFSRDIVGRPTPRMTRHLVPLDSAVSFVDPPGHSRVRSVVAPAFGRRAVEGARTRAWEIVDGLVDTMVAAGPPADVVRHVVSPFPLAVVGELMGVPAEDRPQLRDWAEALLRRAHDDAAHAEAERVKAAARGYFRELAAHRRFRPADDLMTRMVTAVDGGRIDEEELLALATLIGLNGWHAVRNNAANMVYLLLTRRRLRERLLAEPDVLPRAVEELLRWIPHKNGVGQPRIATEDVEVSGVLIRRGEVVQVSYVAACRDPRRFPEPDEIDPDRQGPPHLAFGNGPHHCVAPLLARMEAEVLLSTLLRRLPGLRLAVPGEEVAWQRSVLIRGPVGLPVTW
ncbi:cytochrome P450 [Streptomyces spirodelae]|uniref:Cytochrome P450 n=1 Tax=Streptomyces spirodelae TaxID=2812904 RepID=A0ABS3WUT0_9ACTN|nr:cytochrome P450 [Streptomyces spirodelae]MBO8186895.1 cytochrome P450 [Streptomyces spirodelae]